MLRKLELVREREQPKEGKNLHTPHCARDEPVAATDLQSHSSCSDLVQTGT